MRQRPMLAVLAAVVGSAFLTTAPADAAGVLVFDHGRVRAATEPALDGTGPRPPIPPPGRLVCTRCRKPRARTGRSDAVLRALRRAVARGEISAPDNSRYREIYGAAARLHRRLPLQRRRELGYVISTLQLIARGGRLTAPRMPPLFLILDRNRQWWASKGPPAVGARVRFAGSEVIFQYYSGHGLQLQPLANFGFANGLWQGHKDARLRRLVDELVSLRVPRGGFTTWEYYFHFGGGSPPWISGMAQATAMQALARSSARLADPRLLEIARAGVGAFETGTPVGVRVPIGAGAWYALYSFAPRLYVLNGMLQALIGLDTYRSYANDERANALFEAGDLAARARISLYDTGAWSLYSRGPGRPGGEASLNYHTLNRDFARRLCRITNAGPYCSAAEKFGSYLSQSPELRPFGPAPAPATGGRGVRFHFTLSKVGRVGITVATSSRTYLSTSAPFARGRHYFRWVPPRLESERTYEYKLSARDLAGNTRTETGTLRVKPRT